MNQKKFLLWAAIGLVVGVIIGSFMDNVGQWLIIGLVVGAGIGFMKARKKRA